MELVQDTSYCPELSLCNIHLVFLMAQVRQIQVSFELWGSIESLPQFYAIYLLNEESLCEIQKPQLW